MWPEWPQVAVKCSTHNWSYVHRVYSFVRLGPSPFCKPNKLHAKYICKNWCSLRVVERNARPTIANPKAKILETNFKLKLGKFTMVAHPIALGWYVVCCQNKVASYKQQLHHPICIWPQVCSSYFLYLCQKGLPTKNLLPRLFGTSITVSPVGSGDHNFSSSYNF